MKVIITNNAWLRLEKELDFLISIRKIPKAKALQVGKNLIKKTKKLSHQPYLGQQEILLTNLNQGHRRIILNDFKIIYLIKNNQVYITDFFNTNRNPSNMSYA